MKIKTVLTWNSLSQAKKSSVGDCVVARSTHCRRLPACMWCIALFDNVFIGALVMKQIRHEPFFWHLQSFSVFISKPLILCLIQERF